MKKKTVSNLSDEKRNRIRVAAAAYAYEIENDPVMSDAEFDALCDKIDIKKKTGDKNMDTFFKREFKAHTGMWIHKHPQKAQLPRITKIMRVKKKPVLEFE